MDRNCMCLLVRTFIQDPGFHRLCRSTFLFLLRRRLVSYPCELDHGRVSLRCFFLKILLRSLFLGFCSCCVLCLSQKGKFS